MKSLGMIFIAFGLALLLLVLINFLQEKSQFASPLPEEKGTKVIFVTPTK